MKTTSALIRSRWSKATPGPWFSGGPVRRSAVLKPNLSGQPSGLTRAVYEIGHESDMIPPGIAVVNKYFLPFNRANLDRERWPARFNAQAIAAAPMDVAWLLLALDMEQGRGKRACWEWQRGAWTAAIPTKEGVFVVAHVKRWHGRWAWCLEGHGWETARYALEGMEAAEQAVAAARQTG